MGKYNFSAMKFAEIEKRIEELEKQNEKLREENEHLIKTLAGRGEERNLRRGLKNQQAIDKLFGFRAKNGELEMTDDKATIHANFQTFYTNIFRALQPKAKKRGGGRGGSYLVGTGITEFSPEDWEIVLETMDVLLETISYARDKMSGATASEQKSRL